MGLDPIKLKLACCQRSLWKLEESEEIVGCREQAIRGRTSATMFEN